MKKNMITEISSIDFKDKVKEILQNVNKLSKSNNNLSNIYLSRVSAPELGRLRYKDCEFKASLG
jgi:hypothetical protein